MLLSFASEARIPVTGKKSDREDYMPVQKRFEKSKCQRIGAGNSLPNQFSGNKIAYSVW